VCWVHAYHDMRPLRGYKRHKSCMPTPSQPPLCTQVHVHRHTFAQIVHLRALLSLRMHSSSLLSAWKCCRSRAATSDHGAEGVHAYTHHRRTCTHLHSLLHAPCSLHIPPTTPALYMLGCLHAQAAYQGPCWPYFPACMRAPVTRMQMSLMRPSPVHLVAVQVSATGAGASSGI